MTGLIERPTGYTPALRAHTAARRLHTAATIWIVFVAVSAVLAVLAGIGVLIEEHTTSGRLVAAAALFGVAFWTVGGLLLGLAAQAFARDIEARGPWNR